MRIKIQKLKSVVEELNVKVSKASAAAAAGGAMAAAMGSRGRDRSEEMSRRKKELTAYFRKHPFGGKMTRGDGQELDWVNHIPDSVIGAATKGISALAAKVKEWFKDKTPAKGEDKDTKDGGKNEKGIPDSMKDKITSRDDPDGRWVTINGQHLFINDKKGK